MKTNRHGKSEKENKRKETRPHYEVLIDEEFSASHFLRGYDQGRDEPLHGHNWRVQVQVNTLTTNPMGLAVDFVTVRRLLQREIRHLDYTLINDLPEFQKINPSSENIAKYLYDRLREQISQLGGTLVRVTVWETPRSGASYLIR